MILSQFNFNATFFIQVTVAQSATSHQQNWRKKSKENLRPTKIRQNRVIRAALMIAQHDTNKCPPALRPSKCRERLGGILCVLATKIRD